MKDTEGVRQVLARLGDWYECDEYHIHDDTGEHEGETPYAEHKDFDEEKALTALQEIMLGMLPKKKRGSPLHLTVFNEGYNQALTHMEQNIRGGFKDE